MIISLEDVFDKSSPHETWSKKSKKKMQFQNFFQVGSWVITLVQHLGPSPISHRSPRGKTPLGIRQHLRGSPLALRKVPGRVPLALRIATWAACSVIGVTVSAGCRQLFPTTVLVLPKESCDVIVQQHSYWLYRSAVNRGHNPGSAIGLTVLQISINTTPSSGIKSVCAQTSYHKQVGAPRAR